MKYQPPLMFSMSNAARVFLLGLLLAPSAFAAPYLIRADGTRVEGTAIRAQRDGTIELTTAQGRFTFTRQQYKQAVADQPPELERAAQLAAQKKFDEAIALLKETAPRYQFLYWDAQCTMRVAQYQSAKGDATEAVRTMEEIFRANPAAAGDPTLAWAYRESLMKAKQFDKLSPVLDEVVAKGSRIDAARAQTMRGDVRMSKGQTEQAVLDYLRTVYLFESVNEAQPEALFKAAEALKLLRDPRAASLIQKLKEKYPESDYAKQAG